MGYRHHLYLVENCVLNQLHEMNLEEFKNWALDKGIYNRDDEYIPLYDIGELFFEFGKHYNNANSIQKIGKRLFKNDELFGIYNENEPYIVGKDAVLNAIMYQRELIINYYEELLRDEYEQDKEVISKEKIYTEHILSMYGEWKNRYFPDLFAIDLDENVDRITTSWKYEYSIFELVRLYKCTNWGKYGLIFMGW